MKSVCYVSSAEVAVVEGIEQVTDTFSRLEVSMLVPGRFKGLLCPGLYLNSRIWNFHYCITS